MPNLPLDNVPQYTLLLLSMGFAVYVAQFIHRLLEDKKNLLGECNKLLIDSTPNSTSRSGEELLAKAKKIKADIKVSMRILTDIEKKLLRLYKVNLTIKLHNLIISILIVDITAIFVRIFLASVCEWGSLYFDLSIIVLLFIVHILLSIISIKSYKLLSLKSYCWGDI